MKFVASWYERRTVRGTARTMPDGPVWRLRLHPRNATHSIRHTQLFISPYGPGDRGREERRSYTSALIKFFFCVLACATSAESASLQTTCYAVRLLLTVCAVPNSPLERAKENSERIYQYLRLPFCSLDRCEADAKRNASAVRKQSEVRKQPDLSANSVGSLARFDLVTKPNWFLNWETKAVRWCGNRRQWLAKLRSSLFLSLSLSGHMFAGLFA